MCVNEKSYVLTYYDYSDDQLAIQLNGKIGFWILFLIFIVYRLFVADYFPAARNIFFPAF